MLKFHLKVYTLIPMYWALGSLCFCIGGGYGKNMDLSNMDSHIKTNSFDSFDHKSIIAVKTLVRSK